MRRSLLCAGVTLAALAGGASTALAQGSAVHPIPGPSAPLAALTLAGLPTDRFLFAGFPPPKSAARKTFLAELAPVRATLIFFEGGSRLAATKLHETCIRGTLPQLAADPRLDAPKGEIVVLVGPGEEVAASAEDVDSALAEALTRLPLGEAAAEVAKALGLSRRDLYRRALEMKR